jgi:hypothetical protein
MGAAAVAIAAPGNLARQVPRAGAGVVSPMEGEHALLVEVALPVCVEYGLALAGGYAIKAHGLVSRRSDDVDFATASTAPVDEIIAALRDAYQRAGLDARVLSCDPRKGHLLVALPSTGDCRVDVMKEPLNYPPTLMQFGPVLSLRDAVALKMAALHDRGLPRDLIDIHGASAQFSRTELVALARVALADEFRLDALREQLEFAALYPEEAFLVYGCACEMVVELKRWAQSWANEILLEVAQDQPWVDEPDGDDG